ncbi:hypothetical protein D9619_004908 [Psilocybe cf. subviscida]|uniref:Uncharacterized protein n=1 Tax=Psilocybe cf. subviscida TaxID=2480587 RepID=A0A8H5BT68_9AGAR|nr:hypothetical protein D9619_004908 [Psilocybe cf. subviscida]
MQLKSYVVPLLALVSLAAANLSDLASYEEGHLNSLGAVHGRLEDPMIYGTVNSISCSKRSFTCTATILCDETFVLIFGLKGGGRGRRGRPWRATWPLRSYRLAQGFEGASDISPAENFGRLNPFSIRCDGYYNPHTCKGYVGGSKVIAEWQVLVYRQPGTFRPIDGLSEDELNLWAAHDVNLADDEGMTSEMNDGMDTWSEENDDDNVYADVEDMQVDEAYNPGGVPVSRMTCSRKTRRCTADLIFGRNNYKAFWYFR